MAPSLLRALACSVAAVALILPTDPGVAAQGALPVTAKVLKHARLRLLAQPTALVITRGDVRRGYVDVSAPTELAIEGNSRDGYAIEFAVEAEFVRRVRAIPLHGDVQSSPTGGVIARAGNGRRSGGAKLRLGLRLTLGESARGGIYPWPLRVSIVPL